MVYNLPENINQGAFAPLYYKNEYEFGYFINHQVHNRRHIDRWDYLGPRLDCASKRQRQTRYACRPPGQLDIWLVFYWVAVGIILGCSQIKNRQTAAFFYYN